MKSFMLKFVLERIRNAAVIALIVEIILYIVFKRVVTFSYGLGFIVGCINFILLSLGANLMLSARPTAPSIINFLFFIVRYVLIAYIIIYFYTYMKANIFAMIGGLITINFSIVITAVRGNFIPRKEG